MLPALVAAGASILGGILGNKSKEKAAQREYQQQKEFAQSGIQWKVEDAKKAGIHPVYALGAPTTSYAPQSVGGPDYNFLADAGQNIGRAIDSTRSNPAKAEALALTASQIQLEGLQLDNEIKRAQLASAYALARQQSNPGLPSLLTTADIMGMPGQGDGPQVDRVQPPQFTPSLREGGIRSRVDPYWSDAQAYEDRYGEMSDFVYGPLVWAADKYYQYGRGGYVPKLRPYFELMDRYGVKDKRMKGWYK